MWEQLHLTASAVHSSFDNHTGAFIITTYLAPVHSKYTKRRLHKLQADVPFHDVRPPSGIDQVTCEAVHLALTLYRHERKRKRSKLVDDSSASLRDHRDQGEVQDFQLGVANNQCYLPSRLTKNHVPDSEPPSLGDFYMLDHQNESDTDKTPMLIAGTPSVCSGSATNLSESFQQKRSFSQAPAELATADICLSIIEAAIHFAACGSSSRVQFSLCVSKDSTIRPLYDIMPSIWRPNFLADIASRAVFIPTIAHALRSVLEAAEVGNESQFWDNMRASLQRKPPALRLSPLSEAADVDPGERGLHDELLDILEPDSEEEEMLEAGARLAVATEERNRAAEDATNLCYFDSEDILDDGFAVDMDAQDNSTESMLGDSMPTVTYRQPGSNAWDMSALSDDDLDRRKITSTPTWKGEECNHFTTLIRPLDMIDQRQGNMSPRELMRSPRRASRHVLSEDEAATLGLLNAHERHSNGAHPRSLSSHEGGVLHI